MRIKRMIVLAALIPLMALWGCSSSMDSAGGGGGGGGLTLQDVINAAGFAGVLRCVECHQDFSWSAEAVQAFLQSKHVIHSDHINAGSDPTCLECHDPIGDGPLLEGELNPADVPADGLAAVTCENCHGSGADHYGIGPMPEPTPDYTACGQCHDALLDSHIPYHPLANNILSNYKLGAHFTSIERAQATPAEIPAECSRCHSDEGFRQFYPLTANATRDDLAAILNPQAPLTNVGPVQCRTCHDSHSGALRIAAITDQVTDTLDEDGLLLVPAEELTLTVYSTQFRTCTACHMVFINETFEPITNTFDYALDPVALAEDTDGTRNNHYHGAMVDMVQSHFDNPGTIAVEGYNINAAAANPCTNCHDPHAASKFDDAAAGLAVGTVHNIAEEWANEFHFHGDYQGPAFENGCTPCHSPEGLIALTAGADYVEESTDVGVIACVACHDLQNRNATNDGFALGVRRASPEFAFDNARTIYAQEVAADPAATLATIEGLGDSALCMTCHQGRESTASVDAKIAASAGPYSFTNIHYLAAAATLFGNMAKGAYEFAGKTYSSKFEHVSSNDLCIECHNIHSGQLYLTDPGTGPTGCDNCHVGVVDTGNYPVDILAVRNIRMAGSFVDYDGDGDNTEGIYYEVSDLINMLEATLLADGIMYVPASYPYFFPVGTVEFVRANAAQLTATQLRAAYNLQVASKDPGAYAHNGTYIIEILYDSIEALGGDVSGLTRDATGHFAAEGEPFRHWDEDGEMETSCARCHSSEGARAFFNNGTVTAADFSLYTGGIAAGLACEACHTTPFDGDAPSPARLDPAEVEFPSGVILDAIGAPAFFADDSKLCMSCHQGRSSTDTVNERIASGNNGFSNIHYFAAAASFFGNEVRGGYQYAGQTYANRMTFPAAHNAFGFTTCAGCHMSDPPSHDFKPDVATCALCHGFDGPGTDVQDLGDGLFDNYSDIQTLKTELANVLTNSGVTFLAGYPYFGNITTAAQTRADYNWQVADKEPCGYIHNPDYIKQLLYDSIVDLSGGTVVPSVARP